MQKTKQTKRITPAPYDTLINAIPQLVWTARPDGLHEYTNQRLRDYTELTKKQIQRDRWAHLQFVHPDDQDGNRMYWECALDTGDKLNTKSASGRARPARIAGF